MRCFDNTDGNMKTRPKNMFNTVRKMRFMFRENVSHCLEKKPEFPLQRCDLSIVVLGLDSILYLIYNEVLNKDNDPQRSFWWILYSFFFIQFLLHLFFVVIKEQHNSVQACFDICSFFLVFIFFIVNKPQHLFSMYMCKYCIFMHSLHTFMYRTFAVRRHWIQCECFRTKIERIFRKIVTVSFAVRRCHRNSVSMFACILYIFGYSFVC